MSKVEKPGWEYYPNNLGNSLKGGPNDFAFLICGRKDGVLLSLVLNAFRRHGVSINSFKSFGDKRNKEFAISISADFSEANVSPDNLVFELRRISLVIDVRCVSLKNKFFDGFLFPLTLILSNRVVAIDSSFPFQLQDKLSSIEEKSSVLEDLGRNYVLMVIGRVKRRAGGNSIRDNVLGYLKASGWGSFQITRHCEAYEVIIEDPLTSPDGEAKGNNFLHGIVDGLVESSAVSKYRVSEENYDKVSRRLSMVLTRKERAGLWKKDEAKSPRVSDAERKHNAASKAAAVLEVDRIASFILNKIDARREKDDTIAVISSDEEESQKVDSSQ